MTTHFNHPFDKLLKRALIFLLLCVFLSTLCSCTANWHIKRAAYHTEKAIKKGYKPLHDTIRNQATIALEYNADYLSNLKPRILKQLDSIVISSEDKEKVAQIVIKEVEAAKENIELDSITPIKYKGDSIGFIHATVKDGKLDIKYSIKYPERIVYTETFWESVGIRLKWWHKGLLALLLALFIFLYVLHKAK